MLVLVHLEIKVWKMSSTNDPFCSDGLCCPASEGRSLHDDVSHFALGTVDSLLPTDRDQWKIVVMRYHKSDKKWFRSGEICKNKIEKLAFMKKLTSTAEIPLNVLRAKVVKENVS